MHPIMIPLFANVNQSLASKSAPAPIAFPWVWLAIASFLMVVVTLAVVLLLVVDPKIQIPMCPAPLHFLPVCIAGLLIWLLILWVLTRNWASKTRSRISLMVDLTSHQQIQKQLAELIAGDHTQNFIILSQAATASINSVKKRVDLCVGLMALLVHVSFVVVLVQFFVQNTDADSPLLSVAELRQLAILVVCLYLAYISIFLLIVWLYQLSIATVLDALKTAENKYTTLTARNNEQPGSSTQSNQKNPRSTELLAPWSDFPSLPQPAAGAGNDFT